MTMTLGVNMITRLMTHYFHLLFELYQLVYFISAFEDLQNSISWGPPFALHLLTKGDTFKPVNIDILFLHKIC